MGEGQGGSKERPGGVGLGEELERGGVSGGAVGYSQVPRASGFCSCKEKSDLQIIIVAAAA